MELYGSNPSMEEHQPDSSTSLEESICQLGLGGDESLAMHSERPESMCQLELGGDEGPAVHSKKPGKPDCIYYIRTGSCRYGDSCHFNHPHDRKVAADTNGSDGIVKYPEHVGRRTCQFFLETGTCKYGALCKYDHSRQGGELVQPITLNIHGYPFRLGQKECSYYMRTGLCKFGSTCKFHHPEISGVAIPSLAPTFYSMVQPPAVPTPHQYPMIWPTTLPAPYMQGPYSLMPFSSGVIPSPRWSPHQGNSVCAYYAQFGRCKYGSACKYDHPAGVLNYSSSIPSPVNMPAVRPPVRFPAPKLAPSSSVSELQSEFTSNKDSLISGMLSSESMSRSSADPMLSEGGLVPHSVAESSDQTCTPASSSTADHSGDVSSSN